MVFLRATLLAAGLALLPLRARAQDWNSAAARVLVQRAVARRGAAEADTALRSYTSRAHGMVTFLAELGSLGELATPPRLLKADELDVEVYWQAPDRSKQVIRAWRDTVFFPTEIVYHRDHLGIVTDDFGPSIRIGEGDEVRDVPHPLSAAGVGGYDFAVGDTLLLRGAGDSLAVVALRVRPRLSNAAGVVGTLYLESASAVLVRAQLTFTPSAYRDPDLEDVSVRLDRALYEGRHWLPFRQEIEIRRRAAWLDFPVRGVIRGLWEIGDYTFNGPIAAERLAGPPIGGLTAPRAGGAGEWREPLQAVLDRATRPLDRAALESLRATGSRLVGGRLLDGLPRRRLGIARVSDAVRVNRVQGLTLGLGAAERFGGPLEELGGTAALGTSDGRLNIAGRAGFRLGAARLRLEGGREVRDLDGELVISPLLNSLLAQESGRDHGDYVLLERIAARLRAAGPGHWLEAEVGREWAHSVVTTARPVWGRYRPNPPLGGPPAWTARVTLGRRPAGGLARRDLDGKLELSAGSDTARWARLAFTLGATIPVLNGSLRAAGRLGLGTAALPARRSFVLGGRGTLPGERFRAFGGRRSALASVEWRHDIPGPALSLGPFASTGRRAVVAPFVAAGWAEGAFTGLPWGPSGGVRPVAGVALELFAQSLRIEVAQALRASRGPGVVIDVARAWWPIL